MQLNNLASDSAAAAKLLRAHNETVAVAESSTGGLISAALLAVPGASDYFLGGSVIYTLASRRALLRMSRADVEGLEPLTETMAMVFAQKARAQLGATWGIAELGVAGPTGAPYGQPAGTSVIAISGTIEAATTIDTGNTDREQNMWAFSRRALTLLTETLAKSTSNSPDTTSQSRGE